MRKIKRLQIEEGKKVYYDRVIKDFPACEVKPWEKIELFCNSGVYEMFGMWEDEILLAYAFVSTDESKTNLLLDYFAVNKDYRGKGHGRYFLSHFWELYPKIAGVIVEVEDAECAVNEKDRTLRERRIRFYENAGLVRYPVCAKVYDACYQLMFFSNSTKLPAVKELVESYNSLYRVLLGAEKMKTHMEIMKK